METMANHERLIPDLALCWVVLDGNRQCSRRAYGQPFCRQHNAKATDAGRDAAKAHREQVKAERDREYQERAAAREAEQRANCNHCYTVRDDGVCLVCGTDTGQVYPEVAARRSLYPNSTGWDGTPPPQQVTGLGPAGQVDAAPPQATCDHVYAHREDGSCAVYTCEFHTVLYPSPIDPDESKAAEDAKAQT